VGHDAPVSWRPRILGLGGTTRDGSSSERALRIALAAAERHGADVHILTAPDLELRIYAPERGALGAQETRLLDLVAACDGLIIATPGFHGGPSGLIKNALDHIEELRGDTRPYLEGRAVGCIVCAAGWQATTTTLVAMRSTVHALRGWPTPLGVVINSQLGADAAADPTLVAVPRLEELASQVVTFAHWRHAALARELEEVQA
jgi:FMN reductase